MRTLIISILVSAGPALAGQLPEGPAAPAVKAWFETAPDIRCVGAGDNMIPCKINENTNFKMFYGNGQDALAFVAFTPDHTGNVESVRAALFHKGTSGWIFSEKISNSIEYFPDKVKFSPEAVFIVLKYRRKGDYRIEPTGRNNLRVDFERTIRPTPPSSKNLPPDGLSAHDYLAWIYEPYASDRPSIDVDERTVRRVYGEHLSRAYLSALASVRAGNGPGGLNGDPFVAAQEYKITNLRIQIVPKSEDRVEGIVAFTNVRRPSVPREVVKLDLRREGGGWRIEEIIDPLGRKYSHVLSPR